MCNNRKRATPVSLVEHDDDNDDEIDSKASNCSLPTTLSNGKIGAEKTKSLATTSRGTPASCRALSDSQKQRSLSTTVARTKKNSKTTTTTTIGTTTDNKMRTNLAKFNKNQMAKSSYKKKLPASDLATTTAITANSNKSSARTTSVLAEGENKRRQAAPKQAFWQLR